MTLNEGIADIDLKLEAMGLPTYTELAEALTELCEVAKPTDLTEASDVDYGRAKQIIGLAARINQSSLKE